MPIPELVLLLDNSETMRALKMTAEDLEWLVASGELSPVFIRSNRRFLLSEVESLVNVRNSQRSSN